MKELAALQGIDIYLIDQLLKHRINEKSKILDAGCGRGRNIHYLIENGLDVTALDQSAESIELLQSHYPKLKHQFLVSSLEDFISDQQFDFIICNAVLHFARGHEHFENMFASLVRHLVPNGTLFIRMTSTIGLELAQNDQNGVFQLPDNSERYLITRSKIDDLLLKHSLALLEPVKTVKVEELRSMTTIVLTTR